MIKVFIPQDKRQGKTSVRGLWLSPEGRLYYDYFKVEQHIFSELEFIKYKYNQEALFYKRGDLACVYFNDYKIDILQHKKVFEHRGFKGLKWAIKECLKEYNGVTIYQKGNNYILEVFYND